MWQETTEDLKGCSQDFLKDSYGFQKGFRRGFLKGFFKGFLAGFSQKGALNVSVSGALDAVRLLLDLASTFRLLVHVFWVSGLGV